MYEVVILAPDGLCDNSYLSDLVDKFANANATITYSTNAADPIIEQYGYAVFPIVLLRKNNAVSQIITGRYTVDEIHSKIMSYGCFTCD